MAIRAVVLDIGGVLELTPATGWQKRWAPKLGLEPQALEATLDPIWLRGATGAATLTQVEEQIARALGLPPADLEAFMDHAWAEYLGSLNEELAAYFGALRPRYRTGILSNSFVGAREREQAAYGFEDLCDVIVYSHEEGMLKPDPRIYEIVCRRLGVRPHEVAFLDDTPVCVEGARACGIQAISFTENAQAIAGLETLVAL